MKKLLSVILAAVMTAAMLGVTVSAHGHNGKGCHSSTAAKTKIVYHCQKDCTYCDADGDGICDECGSYGYYCEKDCTFTDADEDGICDNCSTKGVCSYKPKAKSRHCRN